MEFNSVIPVFQGRTVHVAQSYETGVSHCLVATCCLWEAGAVFALFTFKGFKGSRGNQADAGFFLSRFFFPFTLAARFQRFTSLTSDPSPSPQGTNTLPH